MRIICFICGLVLVLSLGSCSKKNNAAPAVRVSSIQSSTGDFYLFAYDNQGRVQTITYSDNSGAPSTSRSFTYSGNQVLITDVGYAIPDSNTLTLNSDGSIHSDLQAEGGGYDILSLFNYTNGEIDSIQSVGAGISDVTTYTYKNGDPVGDSGGDTYSYDLSAPVMPIDALQLTYYEQFGNVGHYLKSTHMLQSESLGFGGNNAFTYTYDKSGRVSTINETGTYQATITITYE